MKSAPIPRDSEINPALSPEHALAAAGAAAAISAARWLVHYHAGNPQGDLLNVLARFRRAILRDGVTVALERFPTFGD